MNKMKILYVNIPAGNEDSETGDFAKNLYVPLLKKNMGLVKSPDTKIVFRFSPYNIPETEAHMAKYGVKDRCAGLRPIDNWKAGVEEGLTQSKQTKER